MLSKQSVILIALLLFSAIAFIRGVAFAGEKIGVTKESVAAILPTGPDMMDDESVRNYTQLVGLGPSAYPALSELLVETEDPIIISRIFSVFVESKGNKTNAVSAIKKTLERFSGPAKKDVKIQIAALDALGNIGDASDCAGLYKLIDSDNERVRINALRAIGRIGDSFSIERIESMLNKRRTRLTKEDERKDYSFRAGVEAINKIRNQSAVRGKDDGPAKGNSGQ